MDEPVLRVEGLTKRFGAFTAVDGVSFALRRGEVLGFLGQNGAGKSTTIKMLCNLIRPSGGDAWLEEQSLFHPVIPARRARIGALVEGPRFYPFLSGRRNLHMQARLRGVPGARADALLEQVGLADKADVRFGTYSMGMRQRLGLAAVFLHEPTLIILDEPTSGLDPVGQRQIQELIRRLASAQGASILFCTHQLAEVQALCQRALVIERGRVVLDQALDAPAGMQAVERCFTEIAGLGGSMASPADPAGAA